MGRKHRRQPPGGILRVCVATYQGLGDDGSRRRPGKDLNLTRGVDQHKPAGSGEDTGHPDTDEQQQAATSAGPKLLPVSSVTNHE